MKLVWLLIITVKAYSLIVPQKGLLRDSFRSNKFVLNARPDVEIKYNEKLTDGMKISRLGNSDLYVSQIGIGTDTFGEKVQEKLVYQILDKATKEYSINFIDTSELNPAPYSESLYGVSDIVLGNWLRKQSPSFRDELIISGHICGTSNIINWARPNQEPAKINRKQVVDAVDSMLRRLRLDHLDILQFQWPDRYLPIYGAPYNVDYELDNLTPIKEQVEILADLIKAGKIRAYGLSNETPFGVGCFATTADLLGVPRPVAVQKPYNLLERHEVETGFIEFASRKTANIPLIAYSPLGGGALTGKYMDIDRADPDARLVKFTGYMYRYLSDRSKEATKRLHKVAENIGVPMSVLSLGWVYSRPHVISTLIGVTSLKQLEENYLALNMGKFEPEFEEAINNVHLDFPDPTKGVLEPYDPYGINTDVETLGHSDEARDFDPLFKNASTYSGSNNNSDDDDVDI